MTMHQMATMIREHKERIKTMEEVISLLGKLGKAEMANELETELKQMKSDLSEICPNDPIFYYREEGGKEVETDA